MEDIKEIKQDVKTLLLQSAVHNQILAEHKNFSIALQTEQKILHAEMEPIKKHVYLVDSVLKTSGMIGAGFVLKILTSYFFNI